MNDRVEVLVCAGGAQWELPLVRARSKIARSACTFPGAASITGSCWELPCEICRERCSSMPR